ncbi:ninein-like protein isoform X2 [Pezoporus occidentalis]|uniref:ninein-like protein isoform X2 n=1 Tax=Pezoporus occidentalis TaxID=407982 RepID=UPI002F913EB2
MVSRSGLQCAALMSYRYKLQCLKIQVRQVARERDKARLDLQKAERRCLRLGRELDKQYVALEHTQSKLRDFQAETEAKDVLLQQALSHQAKLEADTQLFRGTEASWQGRLNHTMKENIELQNKVTEMTEKLAASEKLMLELQKQLNFVVKDKLGQVGSHSPELLNQSECFAEIVLEYERQCQVLCDQNGLLRRELERLYLQLQESRAERGLPAGGLSSQDSSPVCHHPSPLHPTSVCAETSLSVEQLQEQMRDLKVQLEMKINYYEEKIKLMRKNFESERKDSEESFRTEICKMEDQKRDLEETVAKYQAVIDHLKEKKCVCSMELEERFEVEQSRVGQQHTEDIYHPGQQLDQEGGELRMWRRDRESLREELCQLLEENSVLKSQLGRLQQELRLAKEKGSEHNGKHRSQLGREKLEELAEIPELTALSEKSSREISHLNVRMCRLGCEVTEHQAGHGVQCPDTSPLWSQRLAEAERLRDAEMAARLEHHQQHAACWMEMELLQQQLKASQEKLLEAKASLSLAQTRHALQLQQVKAQMNNMVPRKHFEELQTSLRAEQCKAQQLQENLHRQAEQTCRQLLRTQSVRISEQGPGEMDSPGLPGNNPTLVFVACCRRNMSVSCRQLWIRQRRWSTTSGVLKLCWQREQLSLKMPSPNSPGTTC